MILIWPAKDPNEVLDYEIDWTARLDGDTIASNAWTIVSPDTVLVENSSSVTPATATIWLQGGTLGSTYEILSRIVTVGGRTMDQTVNLLIASK